MYCSGALVLLADDGNAALRATSDAVFEFKANN
jgi:hypothetical protein